MLQKCLGYEMTPSGSELSILNNMFLVCLFHTIFRTYYEKKSIFLVEKTKKSMILHYFFFKKIKFREIGQLLPKLPRIRFL